MLMIRLSRTGRKKQPHYRFVISEKGRDIKGRALEILGHYHPLDKDAKTTMVINKERIEYWISHGAGMSNTVKNLLIDKGVVKGDKTRTIGTYKKKKAEADSSAKVSTENKDSSGEKEKQKKETAEKTKKPTKDTAAEKQGKPTPDSSQAESQAGKKGKKKPEATPPPETAKDKKD